MDLRKLLRVEPSPSDEEEEIQLKKKANAWWRVIIQLRNNAELAWSFEPSKGGTKEDAEQLYRSAQVAPNERGWIELYGQEFSVKADQIVYVTIREYH